MNMLNECCLDSLWDHGKRRFRIERFLLGFSLLLCLGCAGPSMDVKAVHDEPSLFVGLGQVSDSQMSENEGFDHPAQIPTANLSPLLARVFIKKGHGLMDSSKPIQAVFSSEEINHLAPLLSQIFQLATPRELVVFALWGSSAPSQELEVTSGGVFLEAKRLHILVANYRERVTSEQKGIIDIRDHPLRPLKEKTYPLIFSPPDLVVDAGSRWIGGGFHSPISELVLDYQGLVGASDSSPSLSEDSARPRTPSSGESSTSTSSEREVDVLKQEISDLKEEMSRLKQQLHEQSGTSSPP